MISKYCPFWFPQAANGSPISSNLFPHLIFFQDSVYEMVSHCELHFTSLIISGVLMFLKSICIFIHSRNSLNSSHVPGIFCAFYCVFVMSISTNCPFFSTGLFFSWKKFFIQSGSILGWLSCKYHLKTCVLFYSMVLFVYFEATLNIVENLFMTVLKVHSWCVRGTIWDSGYKS